MTKLFREYAKTIASFIAATIGNAIVNLINGGVPWPQTKEEWLQFVLTTFGAAIAAWIVPNKITQKQLDKDSHVVGGVVVDVPPVAGEYRNPWKS
jgi:hypothetical protein